MSIAILIILVALNLMCGFANMDRNPPSVAAFNFFAAGFCTMGAIVVAV